MIRAAPLLFTIGLTLAGVGAARDAFATWVAGTELPPVLAETSVEVLDRNGDLLKVFPVEDGRWRLNVDLAHVDRDYLDMLIRYEDQRFHSHAGVDARAMARAVWQAARHGRVVSGGSTLTMQVARLLENGSTGQWPGKLRQIRLALAMEQRFSKDQILSLYLLHAPFGGNIEGVRSASRAWFGKDPQRLTTAEAALLVALPQAPEARRPDRNPVAARAARDRVLDRLTEQGTVTQDAADSARLDPVPHRQTAFPALAQHLAHEMRRDDPVSLEHRLTVDSRSRGSWKGFWPMRCATRPVRCQGLSFWRTIRPGKSWPRSDRLISPIPRGRGLST